MNDYREPWEDPDDWRAELRLLVILCWLGGAVIGIAVGAAICMVLP